MRTDPQAVFEKYEIDYVLYGIDQDLADWLDDASDWERVYGDDLAGVWVRNQPNTR